MAVPIRRSDAIVLGAIALAVAAGGGALLAAAAIGGELRATLDWMGGAASWAFVNGLECLEAAMRNGECRSFRPPPERVLTVMAGVTLLAVAGGMLVSAVDQAADSAADKPEDEGAA